MSVRRVLVAGPAWVGDMVMAQSLLKALRQRDPAIELDVLAPAWSMPLVERMPEVRHGIELPSRHGELGWGMRRALGHSLRKEAYDQAIVLPRSVKAALVPRFARIPVRTGYRGELRFGTINDMRVLDRTVLTQTVQRYVALGQPRRSPSLPPPIPLPALHTDAANRQALFERLGLSQAERYVALLPGAEYGPAKQWPVSHFGMLARRLREAGLTPLILGSPKDSAIGEEIAGYAGGVHNLCGRTRLVEVVDLLSGCEGAVSNDSGLMHIACAVGLPVVAIYGSSTPAFTPPLSERARAVYLDVSCSPCFERQCPLGHTHCLTRITVQRVFTELEGLMAPDAPSPPSAAAAQ